VTPVPSLSHDRRTFIRRAAVVAGAAWVAPQIITTPAGAQSMVWLVEIDPITCEAVFTTASSLVPPCEPADWVVGEPPPVNGLDLNWTIVDNNGGLDCTLGMTLTFTDPGAVILGAEAEETCLNSSPPGETRCVAGTAIGMNGVSWPDNFTGNPEQCIYDVFRIRVQTGS
jgi:hypothetical protein